MLVYPYYPGSKPPETSQIGAKAIAPAAQNMRERVLSVYADHPAGLTADEVAAKLKMSPFSIRPRVSELARMGLVIDTMQRRANAFSGKVAIVWRVA